MAAPTPSKTFRAFTVNSPGVTMSSSSVLRFSMTMGTLSLPDRILPLLQSRRFQPSRFTSIWVTVMIRFHSQEQSRLTVQHRPTSSSSDLVTITRGSSVKALPLLTEDPAATLSRTSAPARSSSMVTEVATVSLVIRHQTSSLVVIRETILMALQRRSIRVKEMILSTLQWVRSTGMPRSIRIPASFRLERID